MRSTAASVASTRPAKSGPRFRLDPSQLSVKIWSALNKAFGEWNTVFPNAACVVSLIDRLVHHSELIDIDGESYRLKEAKERAAQLGAKRKKGKS